MAGQITCALPGCNKPPWPSAGCSTPHLTCGNLHHQLLMASRFNPVLRPHPYQIILTRNADGLCALLCCEKAPYPGHSWCSRTHYLLWLAEFTSRLRPDQICQLPGCTRHVFVDDNAPPSQFCGWEHEQKFVMRCALTQRQEALPAAVEVDHPREEPQSPAPSIESECGLIVPSLHSLMHSLEQFAHCGIDPPKNIRVVEDFYEKHPWEVLTEGGHACLLITRLKFKSRGRKLTTKGHYHWKQSGPRAKTSKLYSGKYYTYRKRKGIVGKEGDEQHAEIVRSYTMKEYTMEAVQGYSLVHLVKDKPSSRAIKQPPLATNYTQQQDVEQLNDDDACSSQDLSWMYLWKDDTPRDAFLISELLTS